ncbi:MULTISPECIES: class I SAM-dependent rRNA methyltransferase [Nitrosomonas]|uniref:23S rRNA (Cytosine1962-C5)-methyltransferase n=1 Tax=Nitrosomonas communis TaxID=44574 RepID=A0A0F7KGT3_9PROT|nr:MULTISPECIES: class I SAM-dependent rRNA methyltransferase [Nitrosomonas]AKH38054.1 23S rRNA methyltransferase [Nitrosomonas communis]TYP81997.1 23S rRNA (cytosine1962-C5)-methyltransferase [Nitrosomonas communis]UVS59950.1 class I SAM-dependent rRNA methyltransferase [Nitrosomonas sp. PLL12]
MKKIILKAGKEKSLLRRHPWVYSGAISRVEGHPSDGDTVSIYTNQKIFLAHAAFHSKAPIAARVWSWQQDERIDEAFFYRKLTHALEFRKELGLSQFSTGCRLVHGESDGLPGLVIDQYGRILVMQIGSVGAERWREVILDILKGLCNPDCIYERSDTDVRELEGLTKHTGVLWGELPHDLIIEENGLYFAVDVMTGQKTGFYLDQRDNRAKIGILAKDKDILNCFCYSGGFSVYAKRAGAKSVLSVDSSEEALKLAQRNFALNGLATDFQEWQCADVFQMLRKLRDQNRKFDLIILDPPKFAPTASFAAKAARGYKDINLLAFKLLRPGGIVATYSCSSGISSDLFQKIIAGAALDAGISAHIIAQQMAAPDHPILLSFPEGAYLKGLLLKVSD